MKSKSAILFLGLFMSGLMKLYAQNENYHANYLYFFLNGFREETRLTDMISYDSVALMEEYIFFNLNAGVFSAGIKLQSNENVSHFFEIMPLRINVADHTHSLYHVPHEITVVEKEGEIITRYTSSLTYQPTFNVFPQKKINPYIGLAGRFEYNYFKFKPYESDVFPYSKQRLGFMFQLNPGVEIHIKERLKLDMDIPITFYSFLYEINNSQNPAIPVNDRTWSKFVSELAPRIFQARIGIGYSF